MPTSTTTQNNNAFPETQEDCVHIGTIPFQGQITHQDTGWNDAEKAKMQQHGYDNLDVVRSWYS